MTLRKAEFEVSCDTNGMGSDIVHLRPSVGTRKARLAMVTLERVYEEASTGTERIGFGMPTITLSELHLAADVIASDDTTGETYSLGRQLFFADTTQQSISEAAVADEWTAKHNSVTLRGETPSTDVLVADQLIRTDRVQCEINNAESGDYFKVTMYYETAGDYRF